MGLMAGQTSSHLEEQGKHGVRAQQAPCTHPGTYGEVGCSLLCPGAGISLVLITLSQDIPDPWTQKGDIQWLMSHHMCLLIPKARSPWWAFHPLPHCKTCCIQLAGLQQPLFSLPVKPDPPESVVAKPVPNNPRRLEVSWQNPSSWPDPESFPLKFFLRYRPLILDQWQHVSDAGQEAAGWQRGVARDQEMSIHFPVNTASFPLFFFPHPFSSSFFQVIFCLQMALQALPSLHFNPRPVSVFHTYVLYKTCQQDVKGI